VKTKKEKMAKSALTLMVPDLPIGRAVRGVKSQIWFRLQIGSGGE
jgi:hypothetical protein